MRSAHDICAGLLVDAQQMTFAATTEQGAMAEAGFPVTPVGIAALRACLQHERPQVRLAVAGRDAVEIALALCRGEDWHVYVLAPPGRQPSAAELARFARSAD